MYTCKSIIVIRKSLSDSFVFDANITDPTQSTKATHVQHKRTMIVTDRGKICTLFYLSYNSVRFKIVCLYHFNEVRSWEKLQ